MSSIIPTIGRKVWFWASAPDEFNIEDHDQALDATVIFVHTEGPVKGTVNLLVIDHQGESHFQEAIELKNYDGERHFGEKLDEPTATWMPYQMGQARKDFAEAKREEAGR